MKGCFVRETNTKEGLAVSFDLLVWIFAFDLAASNAKSLGLG